MIYEGAGICRLFILFSGQEYQHIKHSYDSLAWGKEVGQKDKLGS